MDIESMRKGFEARFPFEKYGYALTELHWQVWQAAKEQAAPCVWTEDENGVYETGCGNLFEITAGTPEENNMRFCPYCGGELVAAPEVIEPTSDQPSR